VQPGSRIRPSRWAWTSVTGAILLVGLVLAIAGLAQRYAQGREGHSGTLFGESALSAIGVGWLLALVPSVAILVATWRLRNRRDGEGRSIAAAALLGVLAVLVLGVGLLAAWVGVPGDAGVQLISETTTWLTGTVLLGSSMWVRHVPRPWRPRDGAAP